MWYTWKHMLLLILINISLKKTLKNKHEINLRKRSIQPWKNLQMYQRLFKERWKPRCKLQWSWESELRVKPAVHLSWQTLRQISALHWQPQELCLFWLQVGSKTSAVMVLNKENWASFFFFFGIFIFMKNAPKMSVPFDLLHYWKCKVLQPLWKTVWRFLKN